MAVNQSKTRGVALSHEYERRDRNGPIVIPYAGWMPTEEHPAGYVSARTRDGQTLHFGWNEFHEKYEAMPF